jgi:hypothetical protein
MTMMMMKPTLVLAIGFVGLFGIPAHAQNVVKLERGEMIQPVPGAAIDVIAMDPLSTGAPVKDAPYSAEAVTEVTQVLSDGNRIEQKTSATIARDSQGRTRREQQGIALGSFVAQAGAPIVTITDPSSGIHFTLNADQKIAYRAKPPKFTVTTRRDFAGGTVAFAGGATWEAATPVVGGAIFETVADPPIIATAPMATTQVDSGFTREVLEPRTIEGLRAEGIRTTMIIPAGAVGNVLPIEVINERWYSPELQVVLMTRRHDPRFGETVYRLINIDRSEPAAELFRVPSDFRIQDLPGPRPIPN